LIIYFCILVNQYGDACLPKVIRHNIAQTAFPTAGTDTLTPTSGYFLVTDYQGGESLFTIRESPPNVTQVIRESPTVRGSERVIDTEIIQLELVGVSGGGGGAGGALVHLNTAHRSLGIVKRPLSASGDYPADSFFDLFVEVDLPGFGITGLYHDLPIPLEAPGIMAVPPLGSSFKTPQGWPGVELLYPNGSFSGLFIREVVHNLSSSPPEWEVIECQCIDPTACHVTRDLIVDPTCAGGCPATQACTEKITSGSSTLDYSCTCVPLEACCFPDGHCEMRTAADCQTAGGTPKGAGTSCLGDLSGNGIDDACEILDKVVCEPQGGNNPSHPSTYWYDVTPTGFGRCDFHVRVYDPNAGDYTNWSISPYPWPAGSWAFLVHQVGTEWWASWWDTDPGCAHAFFVKTRFQFDNPNASTWGDWTTTISNTSDPYNRIVDRSINHPAEADGYGYRVHVPTPPAAATQACCLPNGTCKDVVYNRCLALGGDPQGPDTICDMRVCNPLKWAQPPTYGPVITPQPPCFWGWDDLSNYFTGPIVADDWACSTKQPITDVHWWGSYQNWTTRTPPPQGLGPDLFHIGIWKDTAAGVDRPFSHPGTMIQQWIVPRVQLNERYVGCDEYPGMPSDICFRYDFSITNSNEWFYQKPSADPTVYWISISAMYTMPPIQYPWGWKTREHFFNDDAVRILNPVAPGVGASFVDGLPIETPDGKSWDMAFVLTTRRQAGVKWEQWPNPGLPGLHAHDGITLADNWECAGGKVTDFHWWGNYELGPLGQERRGAGIQCINLSIHRNQPGTPWCLPQEPAEWGICAFFSALHERDTGLKNSEGSKIYLYDFYLPDGYAQAAGDIYWFDIEAQSNNPQDPALWRWQENDRTSVPRLCPAAQRVPPPPLMWSSIQWPPIPPDPPRYSEMAFRVTSRPYPPGPDPTGIGKTRFISIAPGNGGAQTALMVTLTSLHHVNPPYTGGTAADFTPFEGMVRWVGPPQQYMESASSGVLFWASQTQCDPYYRDWSTVSLLHITGPDIVPSSYYDVQAVSASCQGAETGCADVSTALRIPTTRWGDVETPYNPPSVDPQPDTSDISALVNKFKSALGAPIKARALLAGDARGIIEIASDLNFNHISMCVDAFKGLPYPYKPGKCTGDATKACITDADCTSPPNPTTGPCILCP